MFNVLKITAKLSELPGSYCCYSLSTDSIKYIGVCKISELPFTPDARLNVLYPRFFPLDAIATIEIMHINVKRVECFIVASKLIRENQPVMNTHGYVLNEIAPIICNESGEVFQTLEDVVRIHKVSISALSNHLNNKPGYKTVKGRTYKRGSSDGLTLTPPAPTRRKVMNIKTGDVFESAAAVAKSLNVTSVSISNHLSGRLRHIKGNIFTYV